MTYDAPAAYAQLIAPRYAPIADALVEAAALRPTQDALELGAGTGLVTKRVAPRVRSLIATDLSPEMLALARASVRRTPGLAFALVDYAAPLPFLDASFDVVLGSLTFVQTLPRALREIVRVLKPNGRVAFAMWGPAYHEYRLLSDALESLGRGRFPAPAPGRAERALERLGFRAVRRRDIALENEFGSVDEYIAYRRGFGMPAGWTRRLYERYLNAVRRRAEEDADGAARFTLGWNVTLISARRPQSRRGSAL